MDYFVVDFAVILVSYPFLASLLPILQALKFTQDCSVSKRKALKLSFRHFRNADHSDNSLVTASN